MDPLIRIRIHTKMSWIHTTDLEPDPKHRVQERCGLVVEEEDLLDKLEDVDHPVCQQATDALLTAESEADQVPVWYWMTHRRIGSRSDKGSRSVLGQTKALEIQRQVICIVAG
jgi:hypothetical protein